MQSKSFALFSISCSNVASNVCTNCVYEFVSSSGSNWSQNSFFLLFSFLFALVSLRFWSRFIRRISVSPQLSNLRLSVHFTCSHLKFASRLNTPLEFIYVLHSVLMSWRLSYFDSVCARHWGWIWFQRLMMHIRARCLVRCFFLIYYVLIRSLSDNKDKLKVSMMWTTSKKGLLVI